jgi:hypothetical protein
MAMEFVKSSIIKSQIHYVHTVHASVSMSQPSGVDLSSHTMSARLKLSLCHAVQMEYATMSWVADILVNVLEVSDHELQ